MNQTTKEYILLIVGCLLYSLGTSVFLIPANIGSGGATGIALCFNNLLKVPVGLTIIIVNLPLFIFGYKLLGRKFAFRSVFIVFVTSALIDYLTLILKPFNLNSIMSQDIMLSAIFCGITLGIGIALIFMGGGSTGGFDISAKIINSKFPSLSMSNILLIQDILIYIFVAAVLGPRSVMYALIMSFVRTKSLDTIQEGISSSKQCMIICESPKEIILEIQNKLLRGITIIDAIGAYSNGHKKIIYVVIQNNQLNTLKKIVKHIDPHAFVTVSSVSDILGNYRQSSMSI